MNKKFLIIDDDPIIRILIQKMIEVLDESVNCYPYENGETGLSALKALETSADTIFVLLDINMPVLDGWGVLDGLRNMKFNNLQLYIVTSSTDESDIIKAKEYPFIRKFYHKPILNENIIEILNSHDIK
ncbi:MAG: response regulator [Cyclobacteriaceae bacterium]|nr:response regulator [Cyclobacteriaceae bacterium]